MSDVTSASACGVHDGGVVVLGDGGISPYTFQLGETINKNGIFSGIAAGLYSISVRDASGCEATLNNVSVMAQGVSFSTDIKEDTQCSGGNGSVTIQFEEGNAPFVFKLGEMEYTTSNTFNDLASGSYTVLAKDVNECVSVFNIVIPRGNTATSWTSAIQPLMVSHCALSGCHNGKSRPDLRIYENAKRYATQIKTLTQDRSMPFTGSLTQQQIDLIACWVDEGALEN